MGDENAKACVSSPPYLNNFDYADATRLELYFWGPIRSWKAMTHDVRDNLIAGSTQQTTKGGAAAAVEWLSDATDVLDTLVPLRNALALARATRPRGKEYDNLLLMYFADLGRVLIQLRARLEPRARAAFVIGDSAPYGVYVDTPRLVGQMALSLGYKHMSDTPIRERGLRWATNGTRHQHLLAERLLVLRASR
jgi:hypothetical protein